MTEYGKKVGNALRAVRQLYSDASKLLVDCDGTIGKGRPSVFGSVATRDLAYNVRARHYMAEGLYRLYDASDGLAESAGLAEGVTIHFLDERDQSEEPVLLVGQVKYLMEQDTPLKDIADWWDLRNAFFNWSEQQAFDQVLCPEPSGSRIEWLKVIAVPLYEIGSTDDVKNLMDRVRRHTCSEPANAE